MNLSIPKKGENKKGEELFNHQVRMTGDKTKKFTRVREILGGYSAAELLEILVDKAIEAYYDGEDIKEEGMLPKQLRNDSSDKSENDSEEDGE